MTKESNAINEDCVFCKIVRGDFGTSFVAENDLAVAFRDLSPRAPVHVLVVPKRHVPALRDISPAEDAEALALLRLAQEVAKREGLHEGGYRVLTNDGENAGQTVFHLHFHVLGGHTLSSGLG